MNDTLNPVLYKDNKLKPEVREKLYEIVQQFILELSENDIPIHIIDAELVGSNASYNYKSDSDIDLHIIASFEDVTSDPEILNLLYLYFKTYFNNKYNISIYGTDVELYIQDVNSASISNGIYSILSDEWIKEPDFIEIPKVDISQELDEYIEQYNSVVSSNDADLAQVLLDDLYKLRRSSLANSGEFGVGNLVFKEFRSRGYINKLKDIIAKNTSHQLSLESIMEALYDTIKMKTLIDESKSRRVIPSDIFKTYDLLVDPRKFLSVLCKDKQQSYIDSSIARILANKEGDKFYDVLMGYLNAEGTHESYNKLDPAAVHIVNNHIIPDDGRHRAQLCILLNIALPVKVSNSTMQKDHSTLNNSQGNYSNTEMKKSNKVMQSNSNLLERVDVTVRNALAAYPDYVMKYGRGSALFELKYRYHLLPEELLWVINKCYEKGWMNDYQRDWAIDTYDLRDLLSDVHESLDNISSYKSNIEYYIEDKFDLSDNYTGGQFYIMPNGQYLNLGYDGSHLDVDSLLYDFGVLEYDPYEYKHTPILVEKFNAVRGSDGKGIQTDPYIELPPEHLTYDQEQTLTSWLDSIKGKVYVQGVQYEPKKDTSNYIIKRIRRYYDTGNLYECTDDINSSIIVEDNSYDRLNEISDVGYHYGDLGKADYRHEFGNRHSGGFGTGVYFVGRPASQRSDGKYYGSRPEHKVDFSKYHLYRPESNSKAYELHDALLQLNNLSAYSESIPRKWDEVYDEYNKVVSDYYKPVNMLDKDDYTTPIELDDNILLNYIKKYHDYYPYNIDEEDDLMDISRTIQDSLLDESRHFEQAITQLERALNYNYSKDKLRKIVAASFEDKSDIAPSTLIMKSLGYDGIDVRHLNKDAEGLQGLDNFGYGSVIYDL